MAINGTPAEMPARLWRPTAREALATALAAGVSIGYAAILRHFAIEYSPVALTCDGGGSHWLCGSRMVALAFSQSSAFGAIALAAALLNLVRPSVVLAVIGVAMAGFGLVLYNTSTSAVAVALLALSLARSAPAPE
ncbi:MAG: hypothetical protein JSS20_03445 [Proteobacteria bacterium]|nr:hypothetical protein [Pseudomonadota bacterium]